MTDLVLLKKENILTESRLVAEKFNKAHAKVVKKIDELKRDVESYKDATFGTLIFNKISTEYRGQAYEYYEMNQEAFSLLVMGFTGKSALEWKIKFNAEFYRMRNALILEQTHNKDSLWLALRGEGKTIRRWETDVIKEFVDYATAQGSKNAKWYYKIFTTTTYQCLELLENKKPKTRELLDKMQLLELLRAESMARQSILRYMKAEEPYQEIFPMVKKDLEVFAHIVIAEREKLFLPNQKTHQFSATEGGAEPSLN